MSGALTFDALTLTPDGFFTSLPSEVINHITKIFEESAYEEYNKIEDVSTTLKILSFVNRYWYVKSRESLIRLNSNLPIWSRFNLILDSYNISRYTYVTLQIIIWSKQNGCHWNEHSCSLCYNSFAKKDDLDSLGWMKNNNFLWNDKTCCGICEIFARNGNLHAFKWALDNGCKCNNFICSNAAAEGGHLDILK